ncbi:MAG: DNA gyrase subunit A, partial [Zetaproteobacteria bacterium]|nr:DNA gyrase subunit A [Zetaproteobacteria bacterium]
DVLGKYHPHGDTAVYDTIVRMAQPFSYRYPLADGQGNFGSIDGDSAAAMRYTEVRMSKISAEMLNDIGKDTVDFVPNYDDSLKEPSVLPTSVPNLLVNGSTGIAVGMATNIPPHNLSEIIDGIVATIDEPDIQLDQLMQHVPGPDFPTYGEIAGRRGIFDAYSTGRGKVILKAVAKIEDDNGRKTIIISELPFRVNKARLVEEMARLVREKKIADISALRDESDKDGIRVVVEIKRGGNAEVVLNQLYQFTAMKTTFGIINLVLVNNEPKILPLIDMMKHFIEHRKVVIIRRSIYDKDKAEGRRHILEGLRIALDNIDKVVSIIRGSHTRDEAKSTLMETFSLSDVQTDEILKMQLQRLTGLQREKIDDEIKELTELIKYLTELLASDELQYAKIREELLAIKDKYGDERRTVIKDAIDEKTTGDLIKEEEVVVTVTNTGYVKRIPLDTYKQQHRGGKGILGMGTKDEDFVENMYITSTHNYILNFTNRGRVYRLMVYDIPEGQRQSRGKAIVNLLPLDDGETVSASIPVKTFDDLLHLFSWEKVPGDDSGILIEFLVQKFGIEWVKTAKIEMHDGDKTISVTNGDNSLSLKLNEKETKVNLEIDGVDAEEIITKKENDELNLYMDKHFLTMVTRNGIIKRTALHKFGTKIKSKGLIAINIDEGDELVAVRQTDGTKDVIIGSSGGKAMRFNESQVRATGRNSRGVRGMRLGHAEYVVGVDLVKEDTTLLSMTEFGYGKRTEFDEYTPHHRGGKGMYSIATSHRNGRMVTLQAVGDDDELMVTSLEGIVTRMPVK